MKRKLKTEGTDTCFLCGEECDNKCDQCEVNHCSSSHLRVHMQAGRCYPWRVVVKPGVGKTVVATRDIAPFELVMRDTELLGKVHEDSKGCVVCGESRVGSELEVCECGFKICNPQCSEKQHHLLQECLALRSLNIKTLATKEKHNLFRSLGFWRLLRLQESAPDKWNTLINLTSHREKRKKQKSFKKSVTNLQKSLALLAVEGITEKLLATLEGIVETNSHSFNRSSHYIFSNFSLLSHSCIPNSEHLLSGDQAIVRANLDIKKGEEITIRYSELCLHREMLKEDIQTSWLFSCTCPRCEDVTELGTQASSLKCDKCGAGFVLLTGTGLSCNSCGSVLSYKLFIAKSRRLRKLQQSWGTTEEIPNLIEELLNQGCHSLSHSVIGLKIKFLENSQKLDKKTCHMLKDYAKDVTKYLDYLDPGVSRLRGRVLVSLRKAEDWLLEKDKKKDQLASLKVEDFKMRFIEQKMMNGYFKV